MSVLTHIFLNVRSLAEDHPSSAAWRSRGGCGPVPRSLAGESSRCLSKGRSDSSLRGRPQEGCSMTLSCVACTLRTDAAQTAQFHHLETKLRRVAGPCGGRHRPPPGGRGWVGMAVLGGHGLRSCSSDRWLCLLVQPRGLPWLPLLVQQ